MIQRIEQNKKKTNSLGPFNIQYSRCLSLDSLIFKIFNKIHHQISESNDKLITLTENRLISMEQNPLNTQISTN